MKKVLCFDDVLVEPGFSDLNSRKQVDLSTSIGGLQLKLPVMSAPMDTVTTPAIAKLLHKQGGIATLHRFSDIGANVAEYQASECSPIVSVGLNDWDRVLALRDAGADKFCLDVANGAQQQVVEWTKEFRRKFGNSYWLMIGNFATGAQIQTFIERLGAQGVDAWRLGVGSGAACTTRIKTGCGLPTLATVLSCKGIDNLVADGGIKTPGDAAKALAAGAKCVMVGSMLAGTDETGTLTYRGSASKESYGVQGKLQDYITAEGESFTVKPKGPAINVLKDLEGGLRSAFTYVGSQNLAQFHQNATLVEVTSNSVKESKAHFGS